MYSLRIHWNWLSEPYFMPCNTYPAGYIAGLINIFPEQHLAQNIKKSVSVSIFLYLHSQILYSALTQVSLRCPSLTSKRNVYQYLSVFYACSTCISIFLLLWNTFLGTSAQPWCQIVCLLDQSEGPFHISCTRRLSRGKVNCHFFYSLTPSVL